MVHYDDGDQFTAVAQSCRHFSSGGKLSHRLNAAQENVSCRVCKNSNGSKCVINAYECVLSRFDQE